MNFDLDRDSRKVTDEESVGFVNLAGILLVAHWNFLQIIMQFVSASTNRCPSEEPEIEWNNLCQNGLSEKEIKAASKPPIGMGEKLIGNQIGK